VFGLRAVADALHTVEAGTRAGTMLARVDRLTTEIQGRGGCKFPDGGAQMVRSGLRVFEDEVRIHRAGRCSYRKMAEAVA
jgi:NADH:ubiquinone oxidoreductase subunit F (NADH-binding)